MNNKPQPPDMSWAEIYQSVFELFDSQEWCDGNTAGEIAAVCETLCRAASGDADTKDYDILHTTLQRFMHDCAPEDNKSEARQLGFTALE